eukprot:CAMPEP_0176043632 /NCGR_PEP_ID=MMETSP0120_2-20121206/21655_1 /TAXON_ID=160619 /ORGANISM="Kryptoperidinium foliaceum, Strain CCMP 1326" /LENGTH=409 /DNA_ID=CAMNT_0017377043 /DNA_START=13 /DNA_END=1242 /DNA_ORIENTATION=+
MEELKLSGPPLETAPPAEALPEPPPPLPLTGTEPLPIETGSHTFDVQFHPREALVAASTIEGVVELHSFDRDAGTTESLRTLSCHNDSCRVVRFLTERAGASSSSVAGSCAGRLATAAADRLAAVTDIESGKKSWKARMTGKGCALLPMSAEQFAVGDDDGGLRIFDIRQKKAPVRWKESDDFISDLALSRDRQAICATCGDGTLAVYDIRKAGTPGLIAMSDFQEDELLACSVMRDGSKVVCGSQLGVLIIFSWGDFGDQKDRIKGHRGSVDALASVAEDCLLTGASDGKVRAVSVYHKKLGNNVLGIAADHGEFPVERIALSPCGRLFATASHTQPAVKLWSREVADQLFAGEIPGEDLPAAGEDADSDDSDAPPVKKRKKREKKGKKKLTTKTDAQKLASGFFAGL